MKNMKILYRLIAGAMALAVVACDPIEDRDELGSIPTELKYSVTQDPELDNRVFLENQTAGTIPFWDYVLNTSTREKDTVYIPFPGDYWIKFKGYAAGGVTATDSIKITVKNFCADCVSDPAMIALTNRVEGRTWVFNSVSPVGWYGTTFIEEGGDSNDWSYFPQTYNEISSWSNFWPGWTAAGPNKDFGEMTFDINNNFNVSVTQTSLTSDAQSTTKGTFSFDTEKRILRFNGPETLYGGNYADGSNWRLGYVYEITDSTLRVGFPSNNQFILYNYVTKD